MSRFLGRLLIAPALFLILRLMPGPKYAVSINGSRRYWHPNRHDRSYIYRSVTTVTGALPKPALLAWAANTVARYAVTNLNAWTGLPLEDQYDLLRRSPWQTRDRAAARGTTVHSVADNLMQGKSYEVEAILEPWIHALIRFIEDARPRLIRSETTGYNEKTLTAGTFDLLCKLDNAPELGIVLLDWKTSKGVYEDQAVQMVGGYALGFEYYLDDDDKEVEWKPPDTCAIVHLSQDGYTFQVCPLDKVYRRAFLACLEIRKWEEEGGKIQPPYAFRRKDEPTWDRVPTNDDLAHLKARLSLLDDAQRLELMTEVDAAGITTVPKRMTTEDLDRVLGFLQRYPVTEAKSEEIKSRRVSRPMP